MIFLFLSWAAIVNAVHANTNETEKAYCNAYPKQCGQNSSRSYTYSSDLPGCNAECKAQKQFEKEKGAIRLREQLQRDYGIISEYIKDKGPWMDFNISGPFGSTMGMSTRNVYSRIYYAQSRSWLCTIVVDDLQNTVVPAHMVWEPNPKCSYYDEFCGFPDVAVAKFVTECLRK